MQMFSNRNNANPSMVKEILKSRVMHNHISESCFAKL